MKFTKEGNEEDLQAETELDAWQYRDSELLALKFLSSWSSVQQMLAGFEVREGLRFA